MNKKEVLDSIKQLSMNGELSKEELFAAFSKENTNSSILENRLKLSDIMYYIGGGIIFLGISVLAGQNWDSFSSAFRVLLTLGSMLVCFTTATLLNKRENFNKMSEAFFLVSGMLTPIAVEVTVHELGGDLNSNTVQLLSFLVMAAIFLGSFYIFNQTILLFFSVIFSTAVFHYIVSLIVGGGAESSSLTKIWEYQVLVIGGAYMALGYYFSTGLRKTLCGFLYSFGCLFFLGSAMALGGWAPEQNIFWELIYPLIVFGVIFLSVYIKSKSFLVLGVLFLVGYILKLTSEYFSSGLGWPLALVLAGLAIMGVGYWAVKLNKKYFSHSM